MKLLILWKKNILEEEKKEEIFEDGDDEMAITRYLEAHEPVRKRRATVFSDIGKKLIEGNEMLTDESINLAMSSIYEHFTHNWWFNWFL